MKLIHTVIKQSIRSFVVVLACALLLLPSKVLAIYPSGGGLPDIGLDRSLQGSDQATEAFKEKFPFYERDEDGKPITKEFVKYDLANYDLSGLDLRGALFSVATLQRADLEGANLEGSIAYATHFEEANLTNVNFRDSVLTKSFFMATTIDGADFSGAIIDAPQREEMCSRAAGVNPVTGVETYDSLDCVSLNVRAAKS